VLSPGSRMSLNPYYVGYTIFKDIERRWNGEPDPDYPETDWRDESLPRPQGEGLKKIFEVRQLECDTSFLRKYLTEGLVKRLDLYTYKQEEINGELVWVVQETDWRKVRDTLLDSMTNFGIPVITVEDGDYQRRGELLLKHHYDGKPLDKDYARRTLRYIYQIWKRPVHIQTGPEGEEMISWDGKEIIEEPA
jgi:stage V sporulation protein R